MSQDYAKIKGHVELNMFELRALRAIAGHRMRKLASKYERSTFQPAEGKIDRDLDRLNIMTSVYDKLDEAITTALDKDRAFRKGKQDGIR